MPGEVNVFEDYPRAPTYVEIEFPDGSTARWLIPANDPRIAALDKIEELIGAPDTISA